MNQQLTEFDNNNAWIKAHDLILYMDNTSEFYLNKMSWCALFIGRMNKGTFDEALAMKGMDTLRKKVQTSYNEEFEGGVYGTRMKFTANELAEVLTYFLFSIYDEIKEIQFQKNKNK